jgi:hypothetical protein
MGCSGQAEGDLAVHRSFATWSYNKSPGELPQQLVGGLLQGGIGLNLCDERADRHDHILRHITHGYLAHSHMMRPCKNCSSAWENHIKASITQKSDNLMAVLATGTGGSTVLVNLQLIL